LVGTAARTAVVAGTATAVSGRVAHRQHERYADQAAEEAAMAAPPPPAPAPVAEPAGGGDDTVEQIKKLAELRDAGILTEEEFAAKKAQLLGI
jgi:hypothetical protein